MSEEERIRDILKFLFARMIEEGGDGDCVWYSKHLPKDRVFPVLVNFNSSLEWPMKVETQEDGSILWWDNQEYIKIVFSQEDFDSRPYWTITSLIA